MEKNRNLEFIIFRPDRYSHTVRIARRLRDGDYIEIATCGKNDAEDLRDRLNREANND